MTQQIITVTEAHQVAIYVCDNPGCTFNPTVPGTPSQYRLDSHTTPFVQFDLTVPTVSGGVQVQGQACLNGTPKSLCTRLAIVAQLTAAGL